VWREMRGEMNNACLLVSFKATRVYVCVCVCVFVCVCVCVCVRVCVCVCLYVCVLSRSRCPFFGVTDMRWGQKCAPNINTTAANKQFCASSIVQHACELGGVHEEARQACIHSEQQACNLSKRPPFRRLGCCFFVCCVCLRLSAAGKSDVQQEESSLLRTC
jgi:hypothetical protein